MTEEEGILLVDKPAGMTSFSVVHVLRKRLGVKKIGHTGTLDPFATGLLVMLIGRNYTKRADEFLQDDKEYLATLRLGIETDSFDSDGKVVATSDIQPTLAELQKAICRFQGKIEQVPPMFSAKKINGKRLYEMARKGVVVERKSVLIELTTTLVRYEYPEVDIHIKCSKGTYIRTIGHEIGKLLGCLAYVSHLRRLRSGKFSIDKSLSLEKIKDPATDLQGFLLS